MAVEDILRQRGVDLQELKIGAVFSSSEAVKQAVLAGCGPAFLSKSAVAGEIARGELAAVEITGIEMKRSFYLAWRRGRSLSPAAGMSRRVLRDGQATA